MTLNCDYLRLFCIIGAVSIAFHRPYHVGTVSSFIGLRYCDQWSSRGAVIYSGKSHYSHWFREYSRSEEVKEVSSQPIPFSTLQRYQISAVDVYSTLAEQISRGDESLEERVFREFTTGDTSPERKPHIEIWLNQARQFKEQGRFNEAIALNQRCIEEDPSNYRAIIGTATLLWKRRKVDECIRILQQGLQRVRNEPHLIQYLASVYMRIGRSSDALEILKLGIAEYPEHSASWLTLASLHLNKGDISSARSCLSTAVQNDPRAYACYVAWATLEYDSGDLAFAKELIAKALQIAPNSYRAWFVVTRILMSEGKYKEAQDFLLQCIEKAPTVGRLFTSLLEVYERQLQSIDPKLIEEVVQKIVQNSKAYGDGRSLVALIGFEQRQLRRLKLKINDFLIAAGLPPIRQREQTLGTLSSSTPSPPPISVLPTSGDPSAKEMLASLSPIYQPIESDAMIVDLGERINRGTYLYDLQQLVQNQSHVLSQSNQIASFGLFKKLQEQISRIRSYYQLSIQTNKYFTNTWIHWSDFEKTEGNYDVARKILIAGIEKFPNSRTIGKFHVALGDLAALTSDAETARSCYERALQVCPRHLSLPIYSKYYEMELMNDNGVKANKVLQQALTRFPSKREFLTQIRRKYIKDELSLR